MPGLRLTVAQAKPAKRLFGMREDICLRLLATLIAEGMLCETVDHRFATPRKPSN